MAAGMASLQAPAAAIHAAEEAQVPILTSSGQGMAQTPQLQHQAAAGFH